MAVRARELAWIAFPLIALLVLLGRLWFDAPIVDDYTAMLESTLRTQDALSPGEAARIMFSQHNEHRIATARLAAWVMAEASGRIDFRLLAMLTAVAIAGILLLLWAQFRGRVAAPFIGAAGFAICQLTYYESALTPVAVLNHIGVLASALACFHFSMRPGRGNLAAALGFGAFAAGSMANGLIALPLAAVACALRGERVRAGILGAFAVAAGLLYAIDYTPPAGHGSPLDALRHPLQAAWLFVIVVGGLAPGPGPATVLGLALLVALAWLASKRFWETRPAIALAVAFILLFAAAIAAGRVSFGVFWASRYALGSSCLVAIVFLLLVERREWDAGDGRRMFAAAAIASLALSFAIWPYAADYSLRGKLLAKPIPDRPGLIAERYVGIDYPDPPAAADLLRRAEARGTYRAREARLFAPELAYSPASAEAGQRGRLETLDVRGSTLVVSGWTEPPATIPGRRFTLHGPEVPREMSLAIVPRPDVARLARNPDMVFSGFSWTAEFESEEQARKALKGLCLSVQGPGGTVPTAQKMCREGLEK